MQVTAYLAIYSVSFEVDDRVIGGALVSVAETSDRARSKAERRLREWLNHHLPGFLPEFSSCDSMEDPAVRQAFTESILAWRDDFSEEELNGFTVEELALAAFYAEYDLSIQPVHLDYSQEVPAQD